MPSEANRQERREWDSNPRWSFPHTRFPSVLLKPLGHLSKGRSDSTIKNHFNRAIAEPARHFRPACLRAESLELQNQALNVETCRCRDSRLQISNRLPRSGCSRPNRVPAFRDDAVPPPPGSALDSRFSAPDRLSLARGLPKPRGRRKNFPSLNKRRPSSSRSRMSINLTDVGTFSLALKISLRNDLAVSCCHLKSRACGPFLTRPSTRGRNILRRF